MFGSPANPFMNIGAFETRVLLLITPTQNANRCLVSLSVPMLPRVTYSWKNIAYASYLSNLFIVKDSTGYPVVEGWAYNHENIELNPDHGGLPLRV